MNEYGFTAADMDRAAAIEILGWRYDDDYRMYNENGAEEDIREMTDGSCLAVKDRNGGIVGFYCYGEGARAEDLDGKDVYAEDGVTDFGLGLRPDLCGHGLGEEFMNLGLRTGEERFGYGNYRLSVDSMNHRAIKSYLKCGFREETRFRGRYNGIESIFILMKRLKQC